MDNDRLKQCHEIFTDVWRLFKKYSAPDKTDRFWENYEADVDQLKKKHRESYLFQNLTVAVTKEILKIESEK